MTPPSPVGPRSGPLRVRDLVAGVAEAHAAHALFPAAIASLLEQPGGAAERHLGGVVVAIVEETDAVLLALLAFLEDVRSLLASAQAVGFDARDGRLVPEVLGR